MLFVEVASPVRIFERSGRGFATNPKEHERRDRGYSGALLAASRIPVVARGLTAPDG